MVTGWQHTGVGEVLLEEARELLRDAAHLSGAVGALDLEDHVGEALARAAGALDA